MSDVIPLIELESARDHSRCGCCLGDVDLEQVILGRRDPGGRHGSSTSAVLCAPCRDALRAILDADAIKKSRVVRPAL